MERSWVITDSASSFTTSDFAIAGSELGWGEAGYCRKRTLHGGRQEGVEILELCNGRLSLRICLTRGMGILDGRLGEHHLGWRSPVSEVVHPQYINLLEMGGRGAHYGFNELLNRCGIEWSGAMGEDEVVNNMGGAERVFLPLHGKVGWTPASRVRLAAVGPRVVLEGDLPEEMVFGVRYLLRTRLILEEGRTGITVEDTLVNLGEREGEYEMLYHTNFGPPLLEAGSRYLGTFDRLIPRDAFAADGLAELTRMPGPTPGFTEQVFLFRSRADRDGFAHQLLANRAADLAVEVSSLVSTLPYTILWKRCAGANEGYVVGLNPCSDLPNNRREERAGGRLKRVEAGGQVTFRERIDFYEGREAVAAAFARVASQRGLELTGESGDFDFLSGE